MSLYSVNKCESSLRANLAEVAMRVEQYIGAVKADVKKTKEKPQAQAMRPN